MAKTLEELTNETVKEGGVFAVLYFDMHAQDKEQLKQIAVDFASRITREHGVLYAQAEIEEPIEYEGAFSTNAEVHVLTQTFSALLNLAVRYGPLGVEIFRPENFIKLTLGEAHDILLTASQNSLEFTKFSLNRIATEEQKADFQKDLARRSEMGKRLLEKQKEKKKGE
jgi:hypothetical protein